MDELRNTFHKLCPKNDDVIDTYLSANRILTAVRTLPRQLSTNEAKWWTKKKKNSM